MMNKVAFTYLLFLLCGGIFAQTVVSLTPSPSSSSSILEEQFKAYQLLELDYQRLYELQQQTDGEIQFQLNVAAKQRLDFTLQPWEMRSKEHFLQQLVGERIQRIPTSRTATYRGGINGDGQSKAYFTIDEQFLMGRWISGGKEYLLEPLWRMEPDAARNLYVLYEAADARMPADFCGTDHSEAVGKAKEQYDQPKGNGPEKLGNCYTIELALASDFELFQDFGNNATSVENFMLNNLMNVQTNYDDEFEDEIQFEVVTTFIATCNTTTCDPWTNNTNAGTLLDDFTDWGNAGNFGVTFDLASLWTGRAFSGTTIGVAWLNGLCTGLRYNTCENFSASAQTLRVLWSHEIGHNLSSNHDNSGGFIMSPSVNNSTVWSAQSQNAINNFIPSRTCLSECADAAPPLAFIESPFDEACIGSFIPFFDESEGNVSERFWDFPGGQPSFSTDEHPVVFFENPGTYTVSLNVENAQGSDFTSFTIEVAQEEDFTKVIHFENFEDGFGNWGVENPDNDITWQLNNTGGILGSRSAFVNNFDYNAPDETDALVSPTFDLSEYTDARFAFEYAYRRYNNNLRDQLRVSLSVDGGNSFPNVLFEGDETGGGNFATGGDLTAIFTPSAAGDWCDAGPGCIDLDLSAFAGQDDVVIQIENINGFGNNMYVDNIKLTASCSEPEPPTAIVFQDVTVGCAPLSAGFFDESTGAVEYREWEFPGGNPEFTTDVNPIIEYTEAGEYTYSLFVENSTGSDIYNGTITVLGVPEVDFSYTNDGPVFSFTSLATGTITAYEWEFGDGNLSTDPNPVHTYASAGNYTVELRVYNDCGNGFFSENIVIEPMLSADFTADVTSGCAPLSVNFTDLSTGDPDSWTWNFPGATPSSSTDPNPMVVYNSAGSFDVSLTVSKGGGVPETITFQDYITVGAAPEATFAATVTPGSLTVSLDDMTSNSASTTTSWDFGDGTILTNDPTSYTYAAAGTYTITQAAENECGVSTVSQTITLVLPVVPSFTASETQGCTDFSVDFVAAPQAAGQTYAWSFPGATPSSSTSANPTVVYNTAGAYDVSLTITNAAGSETTTQTDYITVGEQPEAAFTATTTPGSLTVSLNDLTNNPANTTTSWNFGDGTVVTNDPTNYTYAAAGTYTITQAVENECGVSTISQTITLVLTNTPSFTASETQGCTPFSVDFVAAPQEAGQTYAWSFPGATPSVSASANPTVVYNTAGTYDVSLTITNAAGSETTTQTNYITVGEEPVAAFALMTTPGSLTVSLNDLTSNPANTTTSWDFGDGTILTNDPTSYTYAAAGTYTITQAVENECGVNTTSQTITLVLPTTPSFTSSATAGCTPFSVDFVAAPQAAGQTYAWSFPGATPSVSASANPTVVYNTAGTYDVSLTITNAAGSETTTQTNHITVGEEPVAAFALMTTPGSLTVSLNDLTSNPANTTTSWDFGDGTILTNDPTSYTYAAAGTYTITQAVENECGVNATSQTITLVLPTTPSFTSSATAGCTPFSVDFVAAPQAAGQTYAWSFPGATPSVSASANPTVVYNTAGTYDVSLTITNAAGSETTTQTNYITVGEEPVAAFALMTTPGSLTVSLNDLTSNPANTTTSWDFGDGTILTNDPTSYTYAAAGTYTITQAVENECGVNTTTETINLVLPASPSFTSSAASGCGPLSVSYEAAPQTAGNTYAWTFAGGDPLTSSEPNPVVVYNTAGTFGVSLTITNAAGSNTTVETNYITVDPLPEVGFDLMSELGSLTISVDGPMTNETNDWSWNFGDGNTTTGTSAMHTYANSGTYLVTLVASNACGSTTSEEMVTVLAAPTASFVASSLEVCPGESVTLVADEAAAGTTYAWTVTGGSPASGDERNFLVNFANPGTYTIDLTTTNAAGSNSSQQTIMVQGLPEAGFQLAVNGLMVTTLNTSTNASSYSWTYPGGSSMEENPSISFPMVGTYEVTLVAANSCGEDTFTQSVTLAGSVPSVNFSSSEPTGCAPLTVTFTSEVENEDSMLWAFPGGEPATSTEANPTVVYNTPGVYPVTLTATNVFGGNSITQDNLVSVSPTIDADFTYDLVGTTADFAVDNPVSTVLNWVFPDGSMSTADNPSYTFAGNGSYEVTLQAIGPCNMEVATQTIVIDGPLPEVAIEASSQQACAPFTVTFSDNSTDEPTSWNWSFPGAMVENSMEPTVEVTYDAAGLYTVALTVTNIYGSSTQSWTDYIEVTDVPATPAFDLATFDNIAYALTVIDPNADWTYNWDFGDNTTAEGVSVEHSYAETGLYTITLRATNDCGSSTVTEEVDVMITNVDTPAWASELWLAPNPTQGRLVLNAGDWPTSGRLDYQLTNALGQRLQQSEWNVSGGNWQQTLDLTSLPAGTYWLQLQWGSERWTKKVVKM